MTRILALLLALLWPANVWAACSLLLCGAGGAGAAPITFSLALTDHQEEAGGGTTVSYSNCQGLGSCQLGAADTNRIVVVCAGARMTTVNTISSMTIAGVSGTLVSGTVAQVAGTNGSNMACYQAAVPTGTTGTISVTYGAATARTGIAIYRVVTGTTTANSSDSKATTGSITNGTLTINAGGAGIVCDFQTSSTSAFSWANATADYDAVAGGSSRMGCAHVSASSSAITPGISVSQVMSAASWGP